MYTVSRYTYTSNFRSYPSLFFEEKDRIEILSVCDTAEQANAFAEKYLQERRSEFVKNKVTDIRSAMKKRYGPCYYADIYQKVRTEMNPEDSSIIAEVKEIFSADTADSPYAPCGHIEDIREHYEIRMSLD